MDEERSTIGNSLGVSVFGLLLGLSALSFLATYLMGGPGAAFAPVEPKPEPPVAVETPSHPPVEVVMAQLAETQKVEKALRSELDTLKRETGDTTGEIERLKQEKAALGKELTVASDDLDSFKARLTETQLKIEAVEKERSAVSAELETIRASTRGEVSRLKGELQSMKRKAEDDAKNWEANRMKLESAADNLEQQNELLKTRLAEGMKEVIDGGGGDNAKAALNRYEAEIGKLKEQIVALEQKLDALGIQRNELSRALRAAQAKAAGVPVAEDQSANKTKEASR